MNKDDVASIVRQLSYDIERAGTSAPWDGYIVNPMAVWRGLQDNYPDVARHIARYYPGDPYQQVKVWVPQKPSR